MGAVQVSPLPAQIAHEMIDRFEMEKQLYRAVFLGKGSVPDMGWANLSATALRGLVTSFGDVSLEEYLKTSIRYTIHTLGFGVSDTARYRLTAWLGAQYALANEL